MARVAISKSWLVRKPGSDLGAAIGQVIHDHGMTATQGPEGLELRGGSQIRMRLRGGWFVDGAALPKWGVLRRLEGPDQEEERITLRLEDRMGLGWMDPRLRRKYEEILRGVALDVEASIRENASEIRDTAE